MPLSFTDLGVPIADTTGRASYTSSGSFTPVAGRLYLLATFYSPRIAGGGGISGATTSGGLTFDLLGGSSVNVGSGDFALAVFYAMPSSTLPSGTYTVTFAGGNRTGLTAFVVEVDGALTTGVNGADAIRNLVMLAGTTADPTLTLGAFADAANATFGAFGFNSSTPPTAGAAFTAIGGEPNISSPNNTLFGQYALDNQATVGCTHAASAWGGIAFEIVAGVGGGGEGRTTKNTRSHALGLALGMNRRMPLMHRQRIAFARLASGLSVPERVVA